MERTISEDEEQRRWEIVAPFVMCVKSVANDVIQNWFNADAIKEVRYRAVTTPPASAASFRVGDTVFHEKYERGVITQRALCAGTWCYRVDFRDFGERDFGDDSDSALFGRGNYPRQVKIGRSPTVAPRYRVSPDMRVIENSDSTDSRVDSRPFDHTKREPSGQFGSFPLHDDYSDEGNADSDEPNN